MKIKILFKCGVEAVFQKVSLKETGMTFISYSIDNKHSLLVNKDNVSYIYTEDE